MKKRIISLGIVFLMVSIYCAVPVHAVIAENIYEESIEKIEADCITAAAQLSSSNVAEYSAVKQVVDFAGNGYTVVEYSPVGYFIFHNESGRYVEYAENAQSPYYGYEENIYYGGPTEYYVKNGDVYYHTVLEDVQIDASYGPEMAESSEQLNQSMFELAADTTVNIPYAQSSSTLTSYITSGQSFFTGNTSFGYVDGGYCGYIAASMVLQYYDYRGSINLGSVAPSGVTHRLIYLDLGYSHQIGSGGSTYPWDVADVLNAYCDTYNISGTGSWAVGVVGAVNELTSNRPVIIMGYLNNAKWHAVVAYGLQLNIYTSDYSYIVHYGWRTAGYDHVVLSGVCTGNVKFRV